VSCGAKLNVKSDGPLDVTLGGLRAGQAVGIRRCDRQTPVSASGVHRYRRARVVRVQVFVNGKRKLTRRGRDIKRVTIGRLPRKTFKVKIVSTQSTRESIKRNSSFKISTSHHSLVRKRGSEERIKAQVL